MAGKKIILAVDDMAENLTLLRSMLEKHFDVRLAKSGNMALTLLENTRVDLILLDIEMPGMSGFEFMKNFHIQKPENKKVPIIFVTSHASTDLIAKAIKEGGKDYVVKPINPDVLYKKIDALIGMPSSHKGSAHTLEGCVQNLLEAVSSGDSALAESHVRELKAFPTRDNTINKRYIDEIVKYIQAFEYEKGIQKINLLLHNLSLTNA
ncbi:MAG: response regulator [Treponema sp.]|jgi:putative two-component system response regulator|nr:response regulator [Treponema sp.]